MLKLKAVHIKNLAQTNEAMFLKKKYEGAAFLLIFIFGAFLRLSGLGYSHFYGDETKTLYLDKTISAVNFLLDQRKGPVQFVATWVMEKLSGGFGPFFIRLPFTLAGILCIPLFYLVSKKFFGVKSALLSCFIFTISGFYVAFSRTAQYQSFLLLFGLLSLLFFIRALELGKNKYIILSSLFFTLSLYCHYDAIFFLVPLLSLFFISKSLKFKQLLLYFLVPAAILLSIFYVPYLIKGYFANNTLNYVGRRISGSEYGSNNSLYTIFVYNPNYSYFIILALSFLYLFFLRKKDSVQKIFYIWFLTAFFFFEVITANPGTHVHNYLLPLLIISGDSLVFLYKSIRERFFKAVFTAATVVIGLIMLFIQSISFIPKFNKGYPWTDSFYGPFKLSMAIKSSSQLYLYGFPYYRSWDKIQNYLYGKDGVRGFYTNDSAAMAKYYLLKYDFTAPGYNFLPQYYIDVEDNMEFTKTDSGFLANYDKDEEFVENGKLTATIYKLKQ